ncbi:hypothetical protein C8J57DRAFT_1491415 [Mycena rebaudengoi]|nr:hypothetical protein C8J57DRAFT_1491415 [Mycena rebaudengoi]
MRLALQDSLLSFSGRLDMVLSQIEMRHRSASGQKRTSGVTGRTWNSEEQAPSSDEEGSEDDDDDDADGDEHQEGLTMNGFIDNEAEEYSEEDDDESE